jgi:hypothetical protein
MPKVAFFEWWPTGLQLPKSISQKDIIVEVVKACGGAMKIINEKLGKRILGNSP